MKPMQRESVYSAFAQHKHIVKKLIQTVNGDYKEHKYVKWPQNSLSIYFWEWSDTINQKYPFLKDTTAWL